MGRGGGRRRRAAGPRGGDRKPAGPGLGHGDRPRHGRRRPRRPGKQRCGRRHARRHTAHARAAGQGRGPAARRRASRREPRGGPRRRPALHPAAAAAADRPGTPGRPGAGRARRHRRHRDAGAGPGRRGQRRDRQAVPSHHRGLPDRGRHRRRGLADQRHPDERRGPQRRAHALHPAGEDLLPPAAARPRLLRARDVGPDHDQDDDGRRRDGHVPADRADHHGQRAADVRRRADRPAGHQPEPGPHAADHDPGAGRGHAGVPREVLQGLRRGAGEGQHGQRRPAGERGRAAHRPGVPPGGPQPGALRRPEQQLPPVAAARAAAHRAVLPVRPAAVDGGRRADPVRGRGRGARQGTERRRPDRLPPLHRPAVLPRAAAVPGIRRLQPGRRRPAADQGPAAPGRPARRWWPGR